MAKKKNDEPLSDKQVTESLSALWALVRRIKDYLEKVTGADIDGDGHIGPPPSGKVWGLVLAGIIAASAAFGWSPSMTNKWGIADDTGTNMIVEVSPSGVMKATGFESSAGVSYANVAISGVATAAAVDIGVADIDTNTVNKRQVFGPDATVFGAGMSAGKILIGSAVSNWSPMTVSGDITLATNGAVTIADIAVADNDISLASGKILIGNGGGTGSAQSVSGDITLATNGAVTINDISVADNDIALADTKIIVGNAGGTGAAVNVSGDIALANTGAMTINDASVADNDIGIAEGRIIIGNSGGTGSAQTISGHITLATNGAVTVNNIGSATNLVLQGMNSGSSGRAFSSVNMSEALVTSNATITFQVKDIQTSNYLGKAVFDMYVGLAQYDVPSTVGVVSVTCDNGVVLEEPVAGAGRIWTILASNDVGTAIVTFKYDASYTGYVHSIVGGHIGVEESIYIKP